MADNQGVFESAPCQALPIPTSSAVVIGNATYDIAQCIVPTYIATLPFDPSAAGAHYTSNADYNTQYNVQRDATTGRVTVSAPSAELGVTISITR